MTAVVVVPSLVVAMRFARRGSVWAQLSTTSLFAYLVYTYAHYLSGTGFNDLFLLQVGVPNVGKASVRAWLSCRRTIRPQPSAAGELGGRHDVV